MGARGPNDVVTTSMRRKDPSTLYICDFFLFHIEIKGKGAKGFVGPSQIIEGGRGLAPQLPPSYAYGYWAFSALKCVSGTSTWRMCYNMPVMTTRDHLIIFRFLGPCLCVEMCVEMFRICRCFYGLLIQTYEFGM